LPGRPASFMVEGGSVTRVRKYILMGVQGGGKGTQARMLARDFDLVHISVGDMLRWNIQNHTKLGAKVRRMLAEGKLVPDDMVAEIVKARLDQHDWNYGFILDGFPRSAAQALFFLEAYDIDAVIVIDLLDVLATERMLSRRLCSSCGLDYNLIQHRPKVEEVCDVCGGRLVTRPDDTPDAIRERVAEYHRRTKPILELFRKKELIVTVDGTPDPAIVQQEMRRKLGLAPPVLA
jgi:adenylate kinase